MTLNWTDEFCNKGSAIVNSRNTMEKNKVQKIKKNPNDVILLKVAS